MKKLLVVLFASMFATGVFAAAHMPGEADKKGDAKKADAKKDDKKADAKKADAKK